MNGPGEIRGWALLMLVLTSSGVTDEPAPLSNNPFSRPPSAVTPDSRPILADDGTIRLIDLRATMVSTTDKLANVAGRTLRQGDEIQGYKLLRIFEDRAVFSKGDARLIVHVKPELVDDDE